MKGGRVDLQVNGCAGVDFNPPDLALFDRFQDAAEGLAKMVNVAGELQAIGRDNPLSLIGEN